MTDKPAEQAYHARGAGRVCPNCNGSGWGPYDPWMRQNPCVNCNGTGKAEREPDRAREGALRSETPGTDLARWIWQRFVGCPVAGEEYEKEFRLLLLKVASYTDEIERRRALADGKEGKG